MPKKKNAALDIPVLVLGYGEGKIIRREGENAVVRLRRMVDRKYVRTFRIEFLKPADGSEAIEFPSEFPQLKSQYQATDRTVAERCFRDIWAGIYLNRADIQLKGFRGLLTIGRRQMGGWSLPMTTGFETVIPSKGAFLTRNGGRFIQDGREPAIDAITIDEIMKISNGGPYTNAALLQQINGIGRRIHFRFIDQLRKMTARPEPAMERYNSEWMDHQGTDMPLWGRRALRPNLSQIEARPDRPRNDRAATADREAKEPVPYKRKRSPRPETARKKVKRILAGLDASVLSSQ